MRGGYRKDDGPKTGLSVIVCSRNPGPSLQGALESVRDCGWPGLECLVVDGGSTDGTLQLLEAWNKKLAVWISEPDRGVYDAMNKGAQLARGDRLLFLGASDRLLPLVEAACRMKDEQAVYYGDVWLLGGSRRYDGVFSDFKLAVKNVCQQAVFYPRELLLGNPFRLEYPILADHELHLRLRSQGVDFRYLPMVISKYDDTSGLSKARRDPQFERVHAGLLRQGFPRWIYLYVRLRNKIRDCLEVIGLRDLVRREAARWRGSV